MALTLNGVKNSLPDSQLPSGYTRPTVTTFSDWTWKYVTTLSVAKATVENATASTTMTNIIDNGTVGLDKQVDDLIENDFDTTNTVTAWVDWTALTTNQTPETGTGSSWLDTTAEAYQCTVSIYIKVA